ncbi:NAD-dependent epimerase/dehydratase family protein [Halarchaeum sp. P4]|uniref:NAD-dependent epimerase/dehydratase family protein n=1 Tax=Halarchaeum sp. P4 TaxID=3421639 RepID=UPI003EBE493B
MDVLVTGAYGRCGTALREHLGDDERYEWAWLDRDAPPDGWADETTIRGDVADRSVVSAAVEGRDAVVHLAGYPNPDGTWEQILHSNLVGTYNVLEAACEHGVGTVVFASTNHVMGLYEAEFAPELYERTHEVLLDDTDPVRPDSLYGVSKSFGEDLGRYYVEAHDYPMRFYALRIGNVRARDEDHPYAEAEAGVDEGRFEAGSAAYERTVAHIAAMWHSRRDFAHQVACCLDDDTVEHGVYTGLSDNANRWFSLEGARTELGYRPRDDGAAWDAPPGEREQ